MPSLPTPPIPTLAPLPPSSPAAMVPNPLLQRKKPKKPSNKKKPSSNGVKGPPKASTSAESSSSVQVGTEEEEREFQERLLEEMRLLALEEEAERAKQEGEGVVPVSDIDEEGAEEAQVETLKKERASRDEDEAYREVGGDTTPSLHQSFVKLKEGHHHHHGLGDKLLELGEGIADKLHFHGTHSPSGSFGGGDKKVSRQQARKLRQVAQFSALRAKAEAEVEQANDKSIEEERKAIAVGCSKLGVKIKDMIPDGHCLYSAIADQANLLGMSTQTPPAVETYVTVRHAAAIYMRAKPDEFLPFLERETAGDDDGLLSSKEYETYCETVESTAEWGGQPEVRPALPTSEPLPDLDPSVH